ncbi:MAG: hypothetical protein H6709_09570 [Kofleriaceae bacterium]|nr:hypothetical protein [Kofleriaceae bacterium]
MRRRIRGRGERTSAGRSFLIVPVCALLWLGCGGHNLARDRALAAADAARARGDVVGEAVALRDACAAAPRDTKLCARAADTLQVALAATRDAADAACALADASAPALDGCLAAVAWVRVLDPADLVAQHLADVAGRAQVAACGPLPDEPTAAIRLVRCAEAREAAIATPTYAAWVTTTRQHAAAQLIGLAAGPDVAARDGAQLALLGAAQCLAPSDELTRRSDQAATAFVAAIRPDLVVRLRGPRVGDVCAAAAGGLADRVACAVAPDDDAIVVDAALVIDPVQHQAWESLRTERYLAGVDRIENPAYLVRADDERSSREAMREAERHYLRDDARCDEAEQAYRKLYCTDCAELEARDRACDRARVSKELYERRESDWQRARNDLDATAPVLEQEDWRDDTFTVRTHRWTAAWHADLAGPAGGVAQVGGATSVDDQEHGGSRAAGIGADPLTEPTGAWYAAAVRDQLGAQIAAVADAELARRVQQARATCPADAPAWTADWLDCWARATFLAGDSPRGATLLRTEAAADDRRGASAGLPVPACR